MTEELEDRLRRTYRAVAERTTVGAGERSVELRSEVARTGDATRWSRLGLVAAAALLLVCGLAVLATTRSEPSADSTGTHVLPTVLPQPFDSPSSFDAGRPPLVSIVSGIETDALEYASDALDLTIRVDRTNLGELDGPAVEVRNGQVASTEMSAEGGRLRWHPSSDATVTIEWTGPVFAGLDSIVDVMDGLVLVDEEVWKEATEFGGFMREQELLRRTVGPTEVYLHGDLQSGLSLGIEPGNIIRASDATCSVFRTFDGTSWLAVSGASSGSATVTWSDGFTISTALEPFVPGMSMGVGVVERPGPELEEHPDVLCVRES